MKRKRHFLYLIFSLLLTGCQNGDYISYAEYIDIVNNQVEGQKDIFIFTSASCSHCQQIKPLIKKIKKDMAEYDFSLYEISVDQGMKISDKTPFSDKTMGYLTGDSQDDGLKRLDNRITLYKQEAKTSDEVLTEISSGKYSYMVTPLVLWYENNIEVKVVNNVTKQLAYDDKGNVTFESFVEFLKFPAEKPNWTKKFDLESI